MEALPILWMCQPHQREFAASYRESGMRDLLPSPECPGSSTEQEDAPRSRKKGAEGLPDGDTQTCSMALELSASISKTTLQQLLSCPREPMASESSLLFSSLPRGNHLCPQGLLQHLGSCAFMCCVPVALLAPAQPRVFSAWRCIANLH